MIEEVDLEERRRRVIADGPDPALRDDRTFFLEVDRLTAKGIAALRAEPASRLSKLAGGGLATVASELRERVLTRASRHELSRPPPSLAEHVRTLSELQIQAMRRYGDVREPRVAERLARAFERFASGALRYEVAGRVFGEPDSAFFCLWAEFAWAACDLAIDVEVWEALLPGLVRSQLVYAFAYGPEPLVRRPFEEFHTGFHPERMNPRLIEFVRHQFFGLSLCDLEAATDRNAWLCFGVGVPWKA